MKPQPILSNSNGVRVTLLSTAALAAFVVSTADRATAAKPQPSPFAGDYAGVLSGAAVTINVSEKGSISGYWFNFEPRDGSVAGSVTDEGMMTLRFRERRGRGGGGGYGPDFVAVVQLDEEGNLVGVGAWEGSEEMFSITFFAQV